MLIEVFVFILIGHVIGYGWAVLALVVASLTGLWLIGREGPRAFRRFRELANAGERPGPKLSRQLVGLLAAVLIAVPGFVTAALGAFLFIPPVRTLAGRAGSGLATRRMSSAIAGDLFGPRRVRVKVGKPTPASPGSPSSPASSPTPQTEPSEPIEGEIM